MELARKPGDGGGEGGSSWPDSGAEDSSRLGERLEESPRVHRIWEPANFVPGLAMLSALHETQYSRLFRS
jgi:hypothetical protein